MTFDQFEITPVGAAPGGECFLLTSGSVSLLCDTGFHFCARQLTENVRRALGGRPLDYVLLTHSHYDHVLGSIECKRVWPECTVIASAHAAEIFAKPHARQLMRELDRSHAAFCGCTEFPDRIDQLHADKIVRDGDRLDLNGHAATVLALPGHTKCCIGFYFDQAQLLLAPETLGLPGQRDTVLPCCLSSYAQTVQSIHRASQLPLRAMLLSHYGLYRECEAFFPRALHWFERSRDLLLQALRAGESYEQIAQRVLDCFFPEGLPDFYPAMAFEVNTRAQMALVQREFMT